ncbi:SPT4, partial [Symbiodinium pilosum]
MAKAQFFELGCPNCRDSLDMQENEARVLACTTANYAGFFSLVRSGAFASRFTGLERRTPGCYALIVHGSLPEISVDEMDEYEPDDLEGELRGVSPGPPKGEVSQQSPGVASPSISEEDFDIDKLLASPM